MKQLPVETNFINSQGRLAEAEGKAEIALSFSEGSIGGDIEQVRISQLEAFKGHTEREYKLGQ